MSIESFTFTNEDPKFSQISNVSQTSISNDIFEVLKFIVDGNIHVLDIRSNDEYTKQHLKNTCNIPWDEIKDRMYELPHGHSELSLIGESQDQIDFVLNYLTNECTKSHRKILKCFIWNEIISENKLNSIVDSTESKNVANKENTNNTKSSDNQENSFENNKNNENNENNENNRNRLNNNLDSKLFESGNIYYRIWDPCVHLMKDIQYIEDILTGKLNVEESLLNSSDKYQNLSIPSHLKTFLEKKIENNENNERSIQNNDKVVTSFEALDLGCGCGRDACWLVSERKWKNVIAVDFRSDRLGRVNKLAESMNVPNGIKTLKVNVKREDILKVDPSLKESLDMIYAIRFIHKPLLPHLGDLLKEGGLIAYCQFYKGAEKFGSPSKEKDILQENEMRNIFKDWIIWMDEIRPCEDGRPLQWFIAQKPPCNY